MESPIPKDILNWKDIIKGVGELIVDESKLVFHSIFDQLRHNGLSDHFGGGDGS